MFGELVKITVKNITVAPKWQEFPKQEKKNGRKEMERDQKVKVTILSLSHWWRTPLLAQGLWKCFSVKASPIAAASLAGKASFWWKQIPVFPWHWVAPATLQLSKNLSDSKEKHCIYPGCFALPFQTLILYSTVSQATLCKFYNPFSPEPEGIKHSHSAQPEN